MRKDWLTARLRKGALFLAAGTIAATGSTAAHAQCSGGGNITFSGVFGDDTAALESAMQDATNRGVTLTIAPGTYIINRALSPDGANRSTVDSGVRVKLRKSFTVNASGATFDVGDRMAGDVFSIDTDSSSFSSSSCGGSAKANVTWSGGSFDMRDMRVSTSVPLNSITTDNRSSPLATADGISIRGAADVNNTRTQKLGVVTISGVSVDSSNGSWREAGGDSGVFVSAATQADITNSTFDGIRDAAIYLSADDRNSSFGRNYTVSGLTITNSYDGITSKRGADNITYTGNTITDTVVPLSIKAIRSDLYATNVTITNNTLRRCVRCILLENGSDATVDGNRLYNVGDPVAGDNRPVNSRGQQYEGIAFEGFRGSNFARNNILQSVSGTRASQVETWAIVRRNFGTRATIAPTTSGNTFQGSWDRKNTAV